MVGQSQKLPVNKFEWIKSIFQFNDNFIKIYWRKWWRIFSWSWCSIPWKLHKLYNDLPFLPERMKFEKVEKLVTNLHDKTEYAIHTRILKQALVKS